MKFEFIEKWQLARRMRARGYRGAWILIPLIGIIPIAGGGIVITVDKFGRSWYRYTR